MTEWLFKGFYGSYFTVLNYQVAVVTGNYWNAGTSAKVYLNMFGERGDTGPRLLHKTKRSKKFEKGKVSDLKIFTM